MRALASVALTALVALSPTVLSRADAAAAGAATTSVTGVYEISIAGWGIARADLKLAMGDGRYDADLEMKPAGVGKIVTAVRTSVEADGRVQSGAVMPTSYRVRAAEIDDPVAVDMKLSANAVTSLKAMPVMKRLSGRIPVTKAHRLGIVDPLSSGLLPIKSADGRDACENTLKIFDGWTRYDVKLYYKGPTTVATNGFSGEAQVCGARWVPVSGHRPQKKEVQYLAANKALEMTVVPLPGAGFAIPYSVRIGTPNGEILIEPSEFRITGAGV